MGDGFKLISIEGRGEGVSKRRPHFDVRDLFDEDGESIQEKQEQGPLSR